MRAKKRIIRLNGGEDYCLVYNLQIRRHVHPLNWNCCYVVCIFNCVNSVFWGRGNITYTSAAVCPLSLSRCPNYADLVSSWDVDSARWKWRGLRMWVRVDLEFGRDERPDWTSGRLYRAQHFLLNLPFPFSLQLIPFLKKKRKCETFNVNFHS